MLALRKFAISCRALVPSSIWQMGGVYFWKRRLKRNFGYDGRRFLAWSGIVGSLDQPAENRAAKIAATAHALEKGLSHPVPRAGFGQDKTRFLIRLIEEYLPKAGFDHIVGNAIIVLQRRSELNASLGHHEPELDQRIEDLAQRMGSAQLEALTGGADKTTREDIHRDGKFDLMPFMLSRHSIRDYTNEPVDPELIKQAIRLAQLSPSVCNRQAWKVHAYFDQTRIRELLAYQNGNATFREDITTLLIITSDLRKFYDCGERFQGWIDGGMFSMSMTLALHSLGLGACCLNWSAEMERDTAMRTAANIPDHELVIMMMSVGHIPEILKVAVSPRRPLEEVLVLGDEHPPA
ncbi:nitroreductase family protein [Mucisphaera sp.]|uniref:nitroreductase family protein n=1 Tax=Mucisphaera sp. TaxID=2913024 RepID=UPI003D11B67D